MVNIKSHGHEGLDCRNGKPDLAEEANQGECKADLPVTGAASPKERRLVWRSSE